MDFIYHTYYKIFLKKKNELGNISFLEWLMTSLVTYDDLDFEQCEEGIDYTMKFFFY